MATLKGQNFRILTLNKSDNKFYCVGMSTNCTVTLTNNADDASTKDDVGMASKPTVTSKSWSVQVESLNVTDTALMLTAIKSMQPFTLMWNETDTSDNQTTTDPSYARTGQAYLNDGTFTFNDRENSTKSLQFQGSGALQTLVEAPAIDMVTPGSYTKGQFVRLFLAINELPSTPMPIAAAKSLSLHVSLTLEDATTKDTEGEWQIQEPTGLSYDISTSALMRSGETITSSVSARTIADIENVYENGLPVDWKIANVGGANNRTATTTIVSGKVIVSSLTMNGPNRQNATYDTQLQGYGDYVVGS